MSYSAENQKVQIFPNPELAKPLDWFEEFELRKALSDAFRIFGGTLKQYYYRIYMTDDVDFIQSNDDKWLLGETVWSYAGLLDLTYDSCFGYNYPHYIWSWFTG